MYSSSRKRTLIAGGSLAALVALMAISPTSASASIIVKTVIPIESATSENPGPVAVAVDTESHHAYVANLFSSSVTVIDTNTNQVTKEIAGGPNGIGSGPTAFAVDSANSQVYVANYNSDSVSVIDTSSNDVVAVIRHSTTGLGIGVKPSAVAIDHSVSKAFVTSFVDGSVAVIDTATNSVTAVTHTSTGGAGSTSQGIAIDRVQHKAYVTNPSEGTVTVLDTRTNAVATIIPHDLANGIGDDPYFVAVDNVRGQAFVSNRASGTVSVIDTATDTVVAVIPHDSLTGIGTFPYDIAIDEASGQAFVTNVSDSTVSVIDTSKNAVTRVIGRADGLGSVVQGVAVDPVHRQAYVTDSGFDTVSVINIDATAPIARVGGPDRFAVSAAASEREFLPEVPVAYVASGATFADALSGSAAAGSWGAPVLLVTSDTIPTPIGAELARLKPKKIIVLGGTNSIGTAVETALRAYSPVVSRLGGADRYAVSSAVSANAFASGVAIAYVASGAVFPDALSGSAAAAHKGAPVLLTTKDAVPAAISTELTRLRPAKIVILGGVNTIGAAVETALGAVAPTTRVAGADRFAVSAAVSADAFASGANTVFVASGAVFPDALSGGAAAANNDAPVLLVTANGVPTPVAAELQRLHPSRIVVLGGNATISDSVYEQLRGFLG
jgi:YVTN family beta-propeller protein